MSSKQRRPLTGTISSLTWTQDVGEARVKIRSNSETLAAIAEGDPFQCALGSGVLQQVWKTSAIGTVEVAHNPDEAESIVCRDDTVRFEEAPIPQVPEWARDLDAIQPVPLSALAPTPTTTSPAPPSDDLDPLLLEHLEGRAGTSPMEADEGLSRDEALDRLMQAEQDAHNEGRYHP